MSQDWADEMASFAINRWLPQRITNKAAMELLKTFAAALREAYERGAVEMKERAASVADKKAENHRARMTHDVDSHVKEHCHSSAIMAEEIAATVRILPASPKEPTT